MKIQVQKVREVKTPTRGTSNSAGIDLYLPADYISQPLNIQPGDSLFIPSGIKVRIPDGYALIAFNKSGVAVKQCLHVGAQVIDSDYDGEVHINVTNVSDDVQTIIPQQKIIQLILLPILLAEVEELAELPSRETQRGEGGFGSTGLQ